MSKEQKGVLQGLVVGILISALIVITGSIYNTFDLSESNELHLAFKALLLPGIFLMISIARLAKYRFFSPQDINGSAQSNNSQQAQILQSLIQNTLEQFCLAITAYTAWATIMPSDTMNVIIYAAICFSIGRTFFFIGYSKGAPGRAFGFTLTFYPSIIMIMVSAIYLIC